jgi:hypothetical protein
MELYNQIKKIPTISYTSRDFDSLRSSLVNYISQQFPDSFNDFSDQSAGMALLESVCYAGDILNFYLDHQFNELFLFTAQEEKNIIAEAKNLGYIIRGKAASQNNNIVLTFNYPTSGVTTAYEFTLRKGTRFSDKSGNVTQEMLYDVDSSLSASKIVDVANNVTSASISGISTLGGVTKIYQINIGSAVPFLKLPLPSQDVLEILSITSSDGFTWYEVDYLAQENQFVGLVNDQSTSAQVPYVLTLKRVPRRFTLEREANGQAYLRFGSGTMDLSDAEFIPNPEDYILPLGIRGAVSGFSPASVDPSDFINTRTLGVAPANCTLTIKYRSGGGLASNASANILTEIVQKYLEYKTTGNDFNKSKMEASMKISNPEPCTGGEDEETLDQIKYNASANLASQLRCVTLQDYIVRTYTMPPNFGCVFRATASKDPNNFNGLRLSIITRNSDGTLTTASDALKINVANYLKEFKSISENLNIVDGKVINLGINFSLISDKTTNQQEILANALLKLQEFFDIRRWNIGHSISISLIQKELVNITGVLAVPEVKFVQMPPSYAGRTYIDSSGYYNLQARIKNNIVQCDPDCIFEVRYPKFDVSGSIIS